jgi:small conductance mechanosensitive channel
MEKFLETITQSLIVFFQLHALKIGLIVVALFLISRFSTTFIEKIIRKVIRGDKFLSKDAEKKREDTLISVLNATVSVLVWLVGTMMILSELGINIGPIIAAAGVAGIAFGFGGQYLIRDVIAGLFIILENQYRVGDVVSINGTAGLVEKINLRLTIIRDLDGTVHHIPNGTIEIASNLSKEFSSININLGVSYNADLEKVAEVINRVGKEMSEDPIWKDQIKSVPKFVRVEEFADSAVIVKILGNTAPLRQWDVAGEMRKRIKIAFDREGIEIPYPQRVIHNVKTKED